MLTRLGNNIDFQRMAAVTHRGVSVAKGPITVLLVPLFLSPEHQGYWFFMLNLATLLYLSDFGLSLYTMQVIANTRHSAPTTDSRSLDLHSLTRDLYRLFFISFFSLSIALTVFVYAFSAQGGYFVIFSWILFLIGSLMFSFLNVEFNVTQGEGRVTEAFLSRGLISLLQLLLIGLFLLLGFDLLSLGAAYIASCSVFFIIYIKRSTFFRIQTILRATNADRGIPTPIKKKYIISWLFGYLSVYGVVPMAMIFSTPTLVGQLGVSFAVMKGVSALSLAPIEAKLVALGASFSQGDSESFRKIFRSSLIYGTVIFLMSSLAFLGIIYKLQNWGAFSNRFIDIQVMIILFGAEFVYFFISAHVKRVRVSLAEPFPIFYVIYFFVIALCCTISFSLFGVEVFAKFYLLCHIFVILPLFSFVYFLSTKS